MNMVTCTKSKRPEGIRRALVLAVFSVFVCGALAGTADAKGRRGGGLRRLLSGLLSAACRLWLSRHRPQHQYSLSQGRE